MFLEAIILNSSYSDNKACQELEHFSNFLFFQGRTRKQKGKAIIIKLYDEPTSMHDISLW